MKPLSLSLALAAFASTLPGCAEGPVEATVPSAADTLPTSVATTGVTVTLDSGTVLNAEAVPAPFAGSCKNTPLAPDDYKIALSQSHAKRVRVKVPSLDAPLYGVLAICALPPSASGPGSRAHRIQIPNEYIDATDGGRVSVVYEEVDGGNKENGSFTSWQLFLSRSAFPSVDGEPPAAPLAPSGTPLAPSGSTLGGSSGTITK